MRAQHAQWVLQTAALALLAIEGASILFIGAGLVTRLLDNVSAHRRAIFSVFLAIPNSCLRSLANKNANMEDNQGRDEDNSISGRDNAPGVLPSSVHGACAELPAFLLLYVTCT